MSSTPKDKKPRAPLSDATVIAVAGLVDDGGKREPSHSEIDFQVKRVGLLAFDPKAQGENVGKAKRVRAILSAALEGEQDKGEILVAALISLVKTKGGFRAGSPNYVGQEAITGAIEAFLAEGYTLGSDGELLPRALDTLSGAALTAALETYVRRARRGSEDAALLTGTSKDLLEATAAHVLMQRWGTDGSQMDFPVLLGSAFAALNMATSAVPLAPGASPQMRLQCALYDAACAVNTLRNKQGTGHGRPWLASVTDDEARAAAQVSGVVAGLLLSGLKNAP